MIRIIPPATKPAINADESPSAAVLVLKVDVELNVDLCDCIVKDLETVFVDFAERLVSALVVKEGEDAAVVKVANGYWHTYTFASLSYLSLASGGWAKLFDNMIATA